jgi:glutamyl-tRNA reductase
MHYQVVSFSHKHCDLSFREKLAFASEEEMKALLTQLVHFEFVYEAFLVSTCNRVEVILATKDAFSSFHAVLGLLNQKSGIRFYELKSNAKVYDDQEAVRHFFSVVASLDSLVIGESQITGQVKDAFKISVKNETASHKLEQLLKSALKCAAEVRNVTDISKNPISMASVAVAQAHQMLGEHIQGMTAVVVGAGEMGVLATKNLLRVGCDVIFLGRDIVKITAVAQSLGENVKVDHIENLKKYINRYKLLFSATSSPETLITQEMIENETIPRFWFDMAIPRDIADIKVEKLRLFHIDDLREISKQNHSLREEKALEAANMIDFHKDAFYKKLLTPPIEPMIKQMRLEIEGVIEEVLQKALKEGYVPQAYEANMKKMAQQMFNKYLHQPTKNLRALSGDMDDVDYVDAMKKIFMTQSIE